MISSEVLMWQYGTSCLTPLPPIIDACLNTPEWQHVTCCRGGANLCNWRTGMCEKCFTWLAADLCFCRGSAWLRYDLL